MISLEQQLLNMADVLEKTAAESEESMEDAMTPEAKEKHEASESKEKEKEEEKEEDEEESSKEEDKKESPKKEAVESIKEELGISDDELAEKVASSHSSVVEYIKELSRVPVESMGEVDTREKTASEYDDEDPFGEFLSTPL